MTSFLLAGYLAVTKGRRVASENPNTRKTTHHMHYDTVIQTCGVDVPAELRNWVPSSEKELPDGTIVDVLAKVYAPANGVVLLDAIQFTAFPGDASAAGYEDSIPDRPFPTLFVLGHTAGTAETLEDGVSVGYPAQTSEYVRDQSRASRVYCRFDGNKARWKKAPRPSAGASVYVVGLAYGLHLADGTLMIDVDQVQLNVGTASASASAPRTDSGPPAKRRRFPVSAGVSDKTNITVASSSASAYQPTSVEPPSSADSSQPGTGKTAVASGGDSSSARGRRGASGKRKAASRTEEDDVQE